MPEVILTENPYDNPWENPWGNPRRRRRSGSKRRGRNPSRNPRGGRLSLQKLMSPQGVIDTFDIERTGGIAAGLIGFQKASEAVGQTGFMDAIVVLGGAALLGSIGGSAKFMKGIADGGIALGLLKVLLLIPGTSQLVSPGSMVIGGSRPQAFLPPAGVSYPRSGVSNKLTFAG